MSAILAVDADWDIVTRYGRAFREAFIFNSFSTEWPAHSIKHLLGPAAVQPQIDEFINENQVDFITGMGHGAYDAFTGFQNSPAWNSDDDLTHLKDIIVHLLSCQTGALLGRSMVKQGVRAFWGYTVNFTFYRQTEPPQDLTSDKTAEVFLRMGVIIDRGMLRP